MGSKNQDLIDDIYNHARMIAWMLEGSDIWACCATGNLHVHLSKYSQREVHKKWVEDISTAVLKGLARPDVPKVSTIHRHPELGAACNGLECKHVPLENVRRSRKVLQLALDTLQALEER